MMIVLPHWEIYARLGENDNRAMSEYVKLYCSDEDFEAVLRCLRRSGYTRFEMVRTTPGADMREAFLQSVED